MALHGWIKTLRGHIVLASLAVFLAACGSSDDGGGTTTGGTVIPYGIKLDGTPVVYGSVDLDNATSTTLITVKPKIVYDPNHPELANIPIKKEWHFRNEPQPADRTKTNTTALPVLVSSDNVSNYEFTPDSTIVGTYVLEVVYSADPQVVDGVTVKVDDVSVLTMIDVYRSSQADANRVKWIGVHDPSKKTNCANCHNEIVANSGTFNPPPEAMPVGHIENSNTCQACHTVLGWDLTTYVDHIEVRGSCSSCHNNVIAIGKSEFHVQTDGECDDCHTTTSFFAVDANGNFDHTGIVDNCAQCHDGKLAIGMPNPLGNHPNTQSDCSACHVTSSFADHIKTDHSDPVLLAKRCDSCHGDPGITGTTKKPLTHPVLGVDSTSGQPMDCRECHNVTSFVQGAVFPHRSVLDNITIQPCKSCHDGQHTASGALGQSNNANHTHAATETECQYCHDALKDKFVPAFVDHSSTLVTSHARCDESGCHDGTGAPGPNPTTHVDIVALGNPNCDACHQPGGSFANGTFDHSVYVAIDANNNATPRCDSCHNDTISIGQANNHIPTPSGSDCIDCHNTTAFTGATVDHNNLGTLACSDCHSAGNGGTAQPRNHIPTSGECDQCHAYPTFKPVSKFTHIAADYDGTGDNGCKTCHNGQYVSMNAQTKPATTHIPTLDDCQSCHNSGTFVDFTDGNYQHPSLNIDANGNMLNPYGCEGCHNGKFKTSHNTILSKADDTASINGHIPTTQDCYMCHTDPGGTWNRGNAKYYHPGITGNCETCHDGTYTQGGKILGKNATHIPVTADCAACHLYPTEANQNYTWASTGSVDHTQPPVTGANKQTCESCHNKTYGDANPAPDGTIVIQYKGQNHKAYPATWDCIACHAPGGSFVPATFDHANVDAATRCDSCHDGVTATGIKDKPVGTHITIPTDPKTNLPYDCRQCHNTTAFAGAKFDHSTITAKDICSDCHNGGSATGKPVNHVPTGDDCRVCHQTTGWIPGLFAHTTAQIGGKRCDDCHGYYVSNYSTPVATDKPAGHVATTQDCGVCHSTSYWKPTIAFDHSTVTASTVCGSCHNGTDATGKPGNHFPTTRDCRDCHNTKSFIGAKFDHQGNVSNCKSCHDQGINKVNAPNKPAGHTATVFTATKQNNTTVDLDLDCDECHLTSGWTPVNQFDHGGNGIYYPGDHNGKPGCYFCHVEPIVPYTWKYAKTDPTLTRYCAGCHKNNFRSNGNHIGGKSGTVEQNRDCSGGGRGCHKASSRSFGG